MKINTLKIHSSNLAGQTRFYSEVIGLELIHKSDEQATFQVGGSLLTLVQNHRFRPYHFAFNIPANREKEALDWLRDRVEILDFEGRDIQDFDSWNAKAIYFYDADRNIVEFIARKNLPNQSEDRFGPGSLLEISEIGMPVNDIETAYNAINEIAPIKIYDGDFSRFCAIGDETGLFICIDKKKKTWFPTGEQAFSADFEIEFAESGQVFKAEFINGDLTGREKPTNRQNRK